MAPKIKKPKTPKAKKPKVVKPKKVPKISQSQKVNVKININGTGKRTRVAGKSPGTSGPSSLASSAPQRITSFPTIFEDLPFRQPPTNPPIVDGELISENIKREVESARQKFVSELQKNKPKAIPKAKAKAKAKATPKSTTPMQGPFTSPSPAQATPAPQPGPFTSPSAIPIPPRPARTVTPLRGPFTSEPPTGPFSTPPAKRTKIKKEKKTEFDPSKIKIEKETRPPVTQTFSESFVAPVAAPIIRPTPIRKARDDTMGPFSAYMPLKRKDTTKLNFDNLQSEKRSRVMVKNPPRIPNQTRPKREPKPKKQPRVPKINIIPEAVIEPDLKRLFDTDEFTAYKKPKLNE